MLVCRSLVGIILKKKSVNIWWWWWWWCAMIQCALKSWLEASLAKHTMLSWGVPKNCAFLGPPCTQSIMKQSDNIADCVLFMSNAPVSCPGVIDAVNHDDVMTLVVDVILDRDVKNGVTWFIYLDHTRSICRLHSFCTIHDDSYKIMVNNTVEKWLFWFPKVKWLQYTGKVGKCISC